MGCLFVCLFVCMYVYNSRQKDKVGDDDDDVGWMDG